MNTKQKIMLAAEDVFANQSYDHATIKSICSLAKVNIASVNYYFRSKKELYLELMEFVHSQINDKVSRIFEYEIKEETPEEWENFVRTVVTAFVQLPEEEKYSRIWQKIIFRELNNPSEVFDEIYQLYFLPILEYIDKGVSKFFPDVDEKERFKWIMTLIAQASFLHSCRGLLVKYRGAEFYTKSNTEALIDHITATVCRCHSD